jgi:hypothetical protein
MDTSKAYLSAVVWADNWDELSAVKWAVEMGEK